MTKIIGVNVRADGGHDAPAVTRLGANGVRIELFERHDLTGLFLDYHANGIKVLAAYTGQSQWAGQGHGGSVSAHLDRYGDLIDLWELGNEPDLASESSMTMDRRAFVRLGWECHNAIRARYPNVPIIAGGMASGDTNYVRHLDLNWCNLLGLHPYAKDMTRDNDLPDIDVLLGQYREVTDKPFAVTEYGYWSDDDRSEYEVEDVVSWAAVASEVEHYWHFAYGDDMVPPFGLLDADGREKPSAAGFRRGAARRQPDLSAWDGLVGNGLLDAMRADGVLPSWRVSRWADYGEVCKGGDQLYVWINETQKVYRVPAEAA